MSQNATASWSGYSHQGKVGLLIALRKINSLHCTGLDDYYVEYETQEDVKLVQVVNSIEVHQVKAYVNGSTKGSYASALLAFVACGGSNYLHTICEITNWDSLTPAQNPHAVQRYEYTQALNYCPLLDIEGYILAEIQAILQQANHAEAGNTGWHRNAYLECQGSLDDRIRQEHATKAQVDYEIRLTLPEIMQLITNPPTRRRMVTGAIRSEIYQQFIDFILRLSGPPPLTLPPAHATFIKEIIERICTLNDGDLELFLNQILPHSTYGKSIATSTLTGAFFTSDGFETPFLRTLIGIQNTPLTLEGNTYPHYRAAENYLLTALQTAEWQKHTVAKHILQHDKLNTARYEARYIITEHYTGNLNDIAPKLLEKKSILAPKDLTFIPVQEAIINLN
jgi:hypothetical protein